MNRELFDINLNKKRNGIPSLHRKEIKSKDRIR